MILIVILLILGAEIVNDLEDDSGRHKYAVNKAKGDDRSQLGNLCVDAVHYLDLSDLALGVKAVVDPLRYIVQKVFVLD